MSSKPCGGSDTLMPIPLRLAPSVLMLIITTGPLFCLVISQPASAAPPSEPAATSSATVAPTPATVAPPITAACFDPAGKTVVVGGQSGIELRAWPELKLVKRLNSQLDSVHHLAFSPDGKWLAACGGSPSERGGVELFAWPPTAKGPQVIRGGEDVFFQLTWEPADLRWIAANGDGRLYRGRALNRAGAGQPNLEAIVGHSRRVLTVANAAGLVFSGGVDRILRVWRRDSFEAERTLNNHTGTVRDLAVRPSLEGHTALEGLTMLASAGADRTVRLWQPKIGRLVRFARLSSAPLDIDWLPDGSRLVAACEDGRIRIIDPDLASVEHVLDGTPGWAYTLVVAPDGESVLVGGQGGALRRVVLPRK